MKPHTSLRHYFTDHSKRIRRLMKALRQQENRDEQKNLIHKLRVETRRLRAVLWLIKHSKNPIPVGDLNRQLRSLGRKLGRIREWDVMQDDIKKFGLTVSGKNRHIERKLKSLGRELTMSKSNRIHEQSLKIRRDLKLMESGHLEMSLQVLRDRLHRWEGQKRMSPSQWHELRILIKKVRYCLDAINRPTDPLQKLQQILGELHDLDVLSAKTLITSDMRRERIRLRGLAKELMRPTLRFADQKLRIEPKG